MSQRVCCRIFPDYDLIDEPEIRQSSYMPGCYVRMELIRRNDPTLIREEKHSCYLLHQANDILGFKNHSINNIQKENDGKQSRISNNRKYCAFARKSGSWFNNGPE